MHGGNLPFAGHFIWLYFYFSFVFYIYLREVCSFYIIHPLSDPFFNSYDERYLLWLRNMTSTAWLSFDICFHHFKRTFSWEIYWTNKQCSFVYHITNGQLNLSNDKFRYALACKDTLIQIRTHACDNIFIKKTVFQALIIW